MALRKKTRLKKNKRRGGNFWKSKEGRMTKMLIIFGIIVALLAAAIAVCVIKNFGFVDEAKQAWLNIVSSEIKSEGFKRENGKKVVCLDPGHGFDDAGAASSVKGKDVLYERDINADVCVRVKEILEENGVQVLLTYGSNTKPDYNEGGIRKYSLDARVEKANKAKADIYVSVHCDSYTGATSSTAKGTRLYYCNSILNGRSGKSKRLATDIKSGVSKKADGREADLVSMDVYNAYQVIRDTEMPAVLIELAFLSDKSDYNKLNNVEWRNQMAQGIAYGIVKYLG